MVMMMVMVMVVMVMMMHWHRFGGLWRRPSRSAGDCGLRKGVSREAERENGRGRKGLDHGRTFLWLGNPNGSRRSIKLSA
jgi:hypothetical protein